MRFRDHTLMILTFLAMSLSAQASPWYPIDTGRSWVYLNPSGSGSYVNVEAPESFAGTVVQPMWWNSSHCAYLSQDGAGRVFHHGTSYNDGSYVVCDPPMLRMDAVLTLGHQWETVVDVIQYNADDTEVGRERRRTTYSVIAVGPVEVMAGTFDAVEILITDEAVPSDGAVASSDASIPILMPPGISPGGSAGYSFRDAYAAEIGWIRRTDENGAAVLIELWAYGVNGVTTETSSWGGLKSQFRN